MFVSKPAPNCNDPVFVHPSNVQLGKAPATGQVILHLFHALVLHECVHNCLGIARVFRRLGHLPQTPKIDRIQQIVRALVTELLPHPSLYSEMEISGTTSYKGLSTYRLVLRRSSSIRNAGGRSSWCRSRYSAISSSAFRFGSASTLAKKRRHTEMPRLTAGASRDKKEAGIALSRSSHFDGHTHIAGATLKM